MSGTEGVRSGDEIRSALTDFVARWSAFEGTERAEAQTFLNELFTCYGVDRRASDARFEEAHSSKGIMDLFWPGRVIVEMKAPRESGRLESHRTQMLTYWHHSADATEDRAAVPFTVLCSFKRFEVWEPGRFPGEPRIAFSLDQLPDRYDALTFLKGDEPIFSAEDRELTTKAAGLMANLYRRLIKRGAARKESVQDFVLQVVWCMFAEDFGMIDGKPVERLTAWLLKDDTFSSWTVFGALFEVLNDPTDFGRHGILAQTRYVNAGLFAKPARVHLVHEELELLKEAVGYDWRMVDPTIFGSLMEQCLGREVRANLGAHYTHEADIMKIVGPTVVRPWRARIDAVATPGEAVALLHELSEFRVLDPACGCGNFLYVAYRELRALERMLKERIRQLAQQFGVTVNQAALPYYPLRNMHGIEVEQVSVKIARMVLWMAQRQMVDRYGPAEPVLPLVSLPDVVQDDALRIPWPRVEAIIGNPPFRGSQWIRKAMGDEYVAWLDDTFKVGLKDFCTYWFRKTHDHLLPGQRAGLVGTNSIAQNRARSASLEYVAERGGVITDAVSSQRWPGDANVHVSLVNWVKEPSQEPDSFQLDGAEVEGIAADLSATGTSSIEAPALPANRGRCFQGPIPVGDGFIIPETEARALLAAKDADYRAVVRPYLVGDDIANDPHQCPTRWIIDFAQLPLEAAAKYPAALKIVRNRVKEVRTTNARKLYRDNWWQLGEPRPGMRAALEELGRYVAAGRIGKRLLFSWQEPWTCPSDLTYVFAFDDDFSMGVLSSAGFETWVKKSDSTLETRQRLTPTSSFAKYPWPDPVSDAVRERVAAASRAVISRRQGICAAEQIGLTKLYNLVDDGAYADLRKFHRELDEAVAEAYGWPKAVAHDGDETVRRLLALNKEIASGKRPYAPFATPPANVQGVLGA